MRPPILQSQIISPYKISASGLKKVHETMAELEHALRAVLPEVVRVHVDPEVFSSGRRDEEADQKWAKDF
jgi:divalent metal cation (Fe/Co/Zn/Cd) transporter